jgi:putative flippase GtrA
MLARARTRPWTWLRFVLVGLTNTFTGLAVIYVCKWALSASDVAANLAGYAVGLTVSYILNARWTFLFRGRLNSSLGRFAVTVAIGYLANLAVVSVALHFGQINSYLAQAAGVVPYALVTYFGLKHYVFVDSCMPSSVSRTTDVGQIK